MNDSFNNFVLEDLSLLCSAWLSPDALLRQTLYSAFKVLNIQVPKRINITSKISMPGCSAVNIIIMPAMAIKKAGNLYFSLLFILNKPDLRLNIAEQKQYCFYEQSSRRKQRFKINMLVMLESFQINKQKKTEYDSCIRSRKMAL